MTKVLDPVTKEKILQRGSSVFYIDSCGKCDEYRDVEFRNNSVLHPTEKTREKPVYDLSRVRLPYKD